MQRLERFATAHPLWFVLLATVAWILIAGGAAAFAAGALGSSLADNAPQSLGTLAATAGLVLVMWRWGWLRPAGLLSLGSWRLWLVTAGVTVGLVAAYQLAFFGEVGVDLSTADAARQAWAIAGRNAVVGLVEEVLFRGFLLYALVRVWGKTRRGLLAAVFVSALIFGLTHIMQGLMGNPLDDTLMTMLNALVGGLWYGALVLLGGSLWPAALIHAASNASVQIPAASVAGFDPSLAAFALATAADVPLVLVGFWLLLRRPRSQPAVGRQGTGERSAAASSAAGLLLLVFLTGALFLPGCQPQPAATTAPAPTRTPHPPLVIETRLTADERRAILDAAWQTVNDGYFDPTFGGLDWAAIGDEYRQKLATVEDDDTFWRQVLNPMLWELGVSHMAALPPELASQLDHMTFCGGSLGMEVRLLDGLAVITRVVEDSPADEAGLRPGFVLVSADGWTLEDAAAQALPAPPYNERRQRASAVQGLRDRLYGEVGAEVVVEYLDGDDRPASARLQFAERQNSTCAEFDPSLPPACAEIEVRRLAGDIGYLRFSGFVNAALDGVLQALDDLHDAPGLIIDLRGNPGGLFYVRKAIAGQLVGAPRAFMRYQYRDHLEQVFLDPVADAYPGQVVILVDEHSASSSEEFSGSLQAMGRATIIGSQTPGVCVTANVAPLPNGAVLMYASSQSQTPDGRVLEDNGVVPDIAVGLDREQLLEGFDAQLEAAVAFLTDRPGN